MVISLNLGQSNQLDVKKPTFLTALIESTGLFCMASKNNRKVIFGIQD